MAVTITAVALAEAIGSSVAVAERLLQVVTDLVETYAPLGPESVQNEAAIRAAGWLADSPPSSIARTDAVTGSVETEIEYGPALRYSALRASGAMGLLSGWKQRRAGVI